MEHLQFCSHRLVLFSQESYSPFSASLFRFIFRENTNRLLKCLPGKQSETFSFLLCFFFGYLSGQDLDAINWPMALFARNLVRKCRYGFIARFIRVLFICSHLRENRVIEILGKVLTPFLVFGLFFLIFSIYSAFSEDLTPVIGAPWESLGEAFFMGYPNNGLYCCNFLFFDSH